MKLKVELFWLEEVGELLEAGVDALRGGLEIFLNCFWVLSFSLLSFANLVTYFSTWKQSHNSLMFGCNILNLSFPY